MPRPRRFCDPLREFVIHTPSLNLLSFVTTFGFLIACHVKKDLHPTNLYCLAGFTLSIATSIGTVCAVYYARGLGLVVLEALALTASVTCGLHSGLHSGVPPLPPCPPTVVCPLPPGRRCGLTAFTLRSKRDFSFMGAGLGASLWVLLLGGFVAAITGSASLHFGMAVAGAVIFSLYIVFDVFMISRRLSPDDYIPAAIELYLDVANLFLHLLRILAEMQRDR